MKRSRVVTFILLALPWAADAATPACVPTELPAPATEGGAQDSFLHLQLVDPANGGAVDADSTVVVDVDYRVAGFQPGEYGLMMYFPALVAAISPHGPEGRYELPKAAGRVRLCVTLREVYDTPRLRWPLSMYVSLNKRKQNVSPKFSAMFDPVLDSERVTLNSVRQPRENQRQQANSVDPAYRDAVALLMGMIVSAAAAGKTCGDVPEVAVEFNAAHRSWTSRNADLIDQGRALQRDLHMRDIARAEIVEEVMNLQMTMTLNRLDELRPDQLLAFCRQQTLAFSNPRSDLEAAAAAPLAVIRAQAPTRSPVRR